MNDIFKFYHFKLNNLCSFENINFNINAFTSFNTNLLGKAINVNNKKLLNKSFGKSFRRHWNNINFMLKLQIFFYKQHLMV